MRYGIDISSVPYGTGVSRYTANLIRALIPLLPETDSLTLFGTAFRQHHRLVSFIRSLSRHSHLKSRLYSFPPSITSFLMHRLNLPISLLAGPCDLFHTWDWYVPYPGRSRLVATVHDLALFKYPATAHPNIKAHHQEALSRLKRFKAHLIAVSESTKKDLIDLFSFSPDDISVIPEALPLESTSIATALDIDQIKAQYQLQKPYFLMVGTREPRKNHEKQIAAWQHFKAQYDLVVVGQEAWGTFKTQTGMYATGYVAGPALAALYAGAALLLYVSLDEGFGLPILEGFYHGVPVITGNCGGMAEVAADAALTVDPENCEAIIAAINQALQKRDEYVKKGRDRLKYFSWTNTAKQTLAVYRQLVTRNS